MKDVLLDNTPKGKIENLEMQKRGFNLTPKKDINRKEIVSNNKLNNENGLVILDFINNRIFKTFDRDEAGKITRSIKKGLRIRVEDDIN